MRLEKASDRAIKYACLNFHYAKKVPAGASFSFSCFNEDGDWCGIVMFGYPPSPSIAKQHGLKNGQLYELRRVALNGNQSSTSKYISFAIKLFKKRIPLCKLLVSWADTKQNHTELFIKQRIGFTVGQIVRVQNIYLMVFGDTARQKHLLGQILQNLKNENQV